MAAVVSNVDAHLEVNPENAIEFVLKQAEATPKVTMTLTHPDKDSGPVAFKVKTTQPRRYLVRPNQGLIQPGGTETVQIILVEKDKVQLMASFHSLGAAALDHCKDKFLVQSVAVTAAQAETLQEYDELTKLWSSVQGSGSNSAVANKKLHVKHKVGDPMSNAARTAPASSSTATENMTPQQLGTELKQLRRKYDELVSFSVNLTAERDMLNNTLEQTKRDLNRQLQNNNSATGGSGKSSGMRTAPPAKGGLSSVVVVLLLILCLMGGAKLQQMGLLDSVPLIGNGNDDEL